MQRASQLLPSAAAALQRGGLTAALRTVSPDPTRSALLPLVPPTLLHRVHLTSGAGTPEKHPAGSSGMAPKHSAATGTSAGSSGTAPAGGGDLSGPGRDFQRWLDDMRQRGYSVTYDAESGQIQVEGQQGKLRLYVKQAASEQAAHRGPNMWKLACGIGGTFLVYKAYGEVAAAGFFAGWVLLSVPWIVLTFV